MFDRILFPLDFSEQSLRMFDCLLELHHLGTREVILCHVAPSGRSLTTEQKGMMDRMRDDLVKGGMKGSEVVEEGDPVEKVLEVADRENVDLIAMASSGKGKAREFIVGSTSFGVLRSSTRPVLINKFIVVRREGATSVAPSCRSIFRKALVPIDFSSCTEMYMDLLPEFTKRGLQESVLFHVVEGSKVNMDDDERFNVVLGDVQGRLDDIRKKLEGRGCAVTTHVHFGTVSYNILEASRELEATVIVLGAHRKSLLRELALGGNSEAVVRRSQVPLLILPCER
ncbi:MAG: universal stress protein [Methanomassiliicoccus sp.]|nr:universal stress protein [Methanomassiliicoccus sp.]